MDATTRTSAERYIPNDARLWDECIEKYGLPLEMLLKITLALGIDPEPERHRGEVRAMLGNDDEYWERVYAFLHAHGLTSETTWRKWQKAPVAEFVGDPERRDLWMMLSLAAWQNERRPDDGQDN